MLDSLLLAFFIALPLAGGLLMTLTRRAPRWPRRISLGVAVALLGASSLLLLECMTRGSAGFVLRESIAIFPQWGISWHLGADSLTASMLFLSALIQLVATLLAPQAFRPRLYQALFQLLFVGVNGSFLFLDAMFFYVFWELMLLPLFFLIAIWGGTERRAAAVKLFLYTMSGSMALLFALFLLYFSVPQMGVTVPVQISLAQTDMQVNGQGEATLYELPLGSPDSTGVIRPTRASELAAGTVRSVEVVVPRDFDLLHWKLLAPHWSKISLGGMALAPLCVVLLFVAFAVKIPTVPLHFWLPHAHVQAPTAISVVLAGILLKLGVYGLLRWVWPLFPSTLLDASSVLAWLGVISIVWGGLAALGQKDLKRMVAYSSISHMGFCVLGLATLSTAGISGAIFQCVTHGFSAALLFLLVGFLYERAHHRRIDGFGGIAQIMPKYSVLFLFAAMAGAGLPGLAGFVGELSVLLGAWQTSSTQLPALFAASGVVLSAGYLLWTVQRVLYGPVRHTEQQSFSDLTKREWSTVLPLVVLIVVLGIAPQILQSAIGPFSSALSSHLHWVSELR